MKKIIIFLCIIFSISAVSAKDNIEQIPLKKYYDYAKKSADFTWNDRNKIIKKWRDNLDPNNIFGYRAPPYLIETAAIYAYLYDKEKDDKYIDKIKNILLQYHKFSEEYPESARKKRPDYADGVPPLPDFFTVMRFIKPYIILKKYNKLNKEENITLRSTIEKSIEYLMRTQEWGPMNRSILRAETFAWACRALPENKNIEEWKNYEYALGFDNWGNWEIEDASLYNAVWLYSLIGYADANSKINSLFKTPEMYYYAQYYLNLFCPEGMIPDFGDSYLNANWDRFLVFFEAAAKKYSNPNLKWAANIIANKFIDFSKSEYAYKAYILLDCYRYGTDDLQPEKPKTGSMEVMEDLVGKKIVFRNGWDNSSTYMLLNYRDEGDGGKIFRDYLRDAIPVEEEKMTHGHSDENSINMLMSGGSILLHDGGYRSMMPSGPYGAYRADYFHNRMCIRPEKIWFGQEKGEYRYSPPDHPKIEGQKVLDFLHNAGSYNKIRTRKIDFLTFDDFDYSRTKYTDNRFGYEWDRAITYIKKHDIFIIYDIIKAKEEGYLTGCNLWHTRKIIDSGKHWYLTEYDSLSNIKTDNSKKLFIYFPHNHYRFESVEKENRYYQKEFIISEYSGRYFEPGQLAAYVTVLIPINSSDNYKDWPEKISVVEADKYNMGLAVRIKLDDKIILTGIKNDLRMDFIRDYRRPRYTYESGRLIFDEFKCNGDFFFTKKYDNKLDYTVVNFSKAVYNGKVLFEQAPSFFGLAFDGSSDQSGVGKIRYRRGTVNLTD